MFANTSLLTWSDFEEVPFLFIVLVVLFASKLLSLYLLKDWYFARRRVRKHPITAEFRPPLDLNPAEIGLIFKNKLNDKDFAGLLVHMAQRGIVHFRKHKGRKVVLPGPRQVDNLKYYEKLIIKTVTENRNVTSENLTTYHRTIFTQGKRYKTFTDQVRHGLQSRNFVTDSVIPRFLLSVGKSTVIAIIILVWFVLISISSYQTVIEGTGDTSTFSSLLYSLVVYSAIVLIPLALLIALSKMLLVRYMGKKWLTKRKFKKFWPHIIGFRQYVILTELDKLRFEDDTLKKKSMTNTLPYAIALEKVNNWRDITF